MISSEWIQTSLACAAAQLSASGNFFQVVTAYVALLKKTPDTVSVTKFWAARIMLTIH